MRHGRPLTAPSRSPPDRFAGLIASAALGHLELSLGSAERGRSSTSTPRYRLRARESCIVEPGATRFVIDQVEALVELGRRDEAAELLDWYEGNARRLERVSALANCVRCRGLLAASGRRISTMRIRAYEEALALACCGRAPTRPRRARFLRSGPRSAA